LGITTDGVPMSACWSEDGLTTLCGRDYTADDHFLFKEINIDGARVVSFNSVDLEIRRRKRYYNRPK